MSDTNLSGWRAFFDGEHSIYVSERHKLLHARNIARGILAHLTAQSASVLDYGCGEALHGEALAAQCSQLWLCDTSPTLREQLAARFAAMPQVSTIAPEMIGLGLADDSLDMVVTISVLQYMTRDELRAALHTWREKLRPGGKLVIGDVIPPDVDMLTDTLALLRFGLEGGFLMAALAGLVRTALSDYRKIREKLGLTMYAQGEIEAIIMDAGLVDVRRADHNIGHNQARMTFTALKSTA
ncbi:MAG: class I SAM-dependent methyltransferase [Bosea sp. (in: a-proteobacteria)]